MWQLSNNTPCHKLVRQDTWEVLELFCKRLNLMSLFYYRTVINHSVVMKLLHDVQLTVCIRDPKLGLKCLPQFLASEQVHICIHKVLTKNANHGAPKQVVSSLERSILIRGERTYVLAKCNMIDIHVRQLKDHFCTLFFIICAIKNSQFKCRSKASSRKVSKIRFL